MCRSNGDHEGDESEATDDSQKSENHYFRALFIRMLELVNDEVAAGQVDESASRHGLNNTKREFVLLSQDGSSYHS